VQFRFGLPYNWVSNRFDDLEGVHRELVDPRERATEFAKAVKQPEYRRLLKRQLRKILGFPVQLSADGNIKCAD